MASDQWGVQRNASDCSTVGAEIGRAKPKEGNIHAKQQTATPNPETQTKFGPARTVIRAFDAG